MDYKLIKGIDFNFKLALILILGAILRFYNLDFQSIWLDEIHTMIESSPLLSYKEFHEIMYSRELMPHFYFLLVRLFTYLIDHSVIVVRSISAIIGIASIYSIYFLGKELVSKKAGLLASLFLAVNHFHIFYSQEARPYILLCLFTILSFLFLLRFTKKLTFKSGVYYAFFAGLMINTHFFGLFVLISQALILLIYLLNVQRDHRKKLFINATISGGIIVLLFLPSISILIKTSNLNTFWVQSNSPIFFKELFSRFFGNSEFLIYTAAFLAIAFFIKCFSEQQKESVNVGNKYSISFIFLIVWLFTIFMIPYIRSYTNVPMLSTRYFMSALPAIILIVALGLYTIKSKRIVVLIAGIFVFSSFVDLIIVKDYYKRVNKTQYREITAEVNLKNVKNDPVISPWAWHLEYFIDKDNNTLINNTLNQYVDKRRLGQGKLTNFWFLDAHFHPFNITPQNQSYLDANYYLIDEIKYFDTFAKYYLLKNNDSIIKLNLSDFTPKWFYNNNTILLTSNNIVASKDIIVDKGKYRLAIKTKSNPNPPINNENAHIEVSISGKRLGGFYTSSEEIETTIFDFNIDESKKINIEFTFGNDYFDSKGDRDLVIYSASIEKLSEEL